MADTYRWPHPYAWLEESSRGWDDEVLRARMLEFAQRAGSDEIQELFESSMDKDGYFKPTPQS